MTDSTPHTSEIVASQSPLPASVVNTLEEISSSNPSGPSSHAPEELGRGKRKKRRTRKYIDPLPEPPAPLPEVGLPTPMETSSSSIQAAVSCRTQKNANGLYREYPCRPTFVPDESTMHMLDDAVEGDESNPALPAVSQHSTTDRPVGTEISRNWFAPFVNVTTYRLMKWFWCRSESKTTADLQSLADDVLKSSDFSYEDLAKFSAKCENKRLDDWVNDQDKTPFNAEDGWRKASVRISLPTRSKSVSINDTPPSFTVEGLHYRPILEVIKAAFRSSAAMRYHYTPFKQFWQFDNSKPPERVYDELYTADAWLQEHQRIQQLRRAPSDEYERIIAGLMLWSDSTHLTDFGNASLWPVYLYFGNQSKYDRARPNSHACHHLAYLPKARLYS